MLYNPLCVVQRRALGTPKVKSHDFLSKELAKDKIHIICGMGANGHIFSAQVESIQLHDVCDLIRIPHYERMNTNTAYLNECHIDKGSFPILKMMRILHTAPSYLGPSEGSSNV